MLKNQPYKLAPTFKSLSRPEDICKFLAGEENRHIREPSTFKKDFSFGTYITKNLTKGISQVDIFSEQLVQFNHNDLLEYTEGPEFEEFDPIKYACKQFPRDIPKPLDKLFDLDNDLSMHLII